MPGDSHWIRHFAQSEDETRQLLERMRPLTDIKLHTLMLTHNVTSKFIHSLRTSLPDHTSISHFHAVDQLIQNAFLDRALPDWQHSATTSPDDFRCMAQQPASDRQDAGFGIGGLADAFGAHYYTTINVIIVIHFEVFAGFQCHCWRSFVRRSPDGRGPDGK